MGSNLYKIRLANKDKVKGKSADFRIITYSVEETETECVIYLVKIYDKSEESTVKKADLLKIIASIFKE